MEFIEECFKATTKIHNVNITSIHMMSIWGVYGENWKTPNKTLITMTIFKKKINKKKFLVTSIVFFKFNSVLLIKRKFSPFKNFFALPGGFVMSVKL